MTLADLDRLDAQLVKGSTMTCEFVDALRPILRWLRWLLEGKNP